MATINDRAVVDKIIANDGQFEDDPPVIKIVKYQNAFNGNDAYGLIYKGQSRSMYDASPYVLNPQVLFEKEENGGGTWTKADPHPNPKPEKKWFGTWPANCGICQYVYGKQTPLADQEYFVDGQTNRGPWALMCPTCHESLGMGLGMGRGQKYDSKTLVKLAG